MNKKIWFFLYFWIRQKNGFPIVTAKNGFHILNLHPKKHIFQEKRYPVFNANLLEKFWNSGKFGNSCIKCIFTVLILLKGIDYIYFLGIKQHQKVSASGKVLGNAAHLLTVVRGHVLRISLLFSSSLRKLSMVTPNRRGTRLFLPFIFSFTRKKVTP